MVSCSQSKQARQIQVIICHTSIHIAQPTNIILFLQVDIHHIFILLNLSFGKLIQVSFLFIYLDGVYRVCRQVLQEYRIVTLEEILAIKQEALHKPTIDINAAIRLQFRTRQLLDECIEHGAFGKLEGISIIHQRITLVIEFHLGGRDCYFIQLQFIIQFFLLT